MLKPSLYEEDFVVWTTHNAELLRAGRLQEADIERIAEELEDLGKSQRRALESRLTGLLLLLLKWHFQQERRSSSRRAKIVAQRIAIAKILREAPSLESHFSNVAGEAYRDAVELAIAETELPAERFPSEVPYALDQLLNRDFFPDQAGA